MMDEMLDWFAPALRVYFNSKQTFAEFSLEKFKNLRCI